MANDHVTFGISIPEIFTAGFNGWKNNIVPLTLAGLVTTGISTAASAQAATFEQSDFSWIIVNFIGWVIAGTAAYPWYVYALAAADGEKADLRAPFENTKRFLHQFVASFWFFAAFLLGIRYFLLPALLVLMLYAFYGYVVAESNKGGTYALGTSVRLGEKRRIGLFGIATLFLVFNLFGVMFGLAVEQPVLRVVLSTLGLTITTSITLVAGAAIYRVLQGYLQ